MHHHIPMSLHQTCMLQDMQTLLLSPQVPPLVWAAMSAARTAALLAAAVLCHAYGPAVQIGSAVVVGAAMGYSGHRKGSLSASGGTLHLCLSGFLSLAHAATANLRWPCSTCNWYTRIQSFTKPGEGCQLGPAQAQSHVISCKGPTWSPMTRQNMITKGQGNSSAC